MRKGLTVFSSHHGLMRKKCMKKYALVGTLEAHGVDQKLFSAFAQVDGAEEMVTTQEICAVSWCSLFCVSAVHF
jgi:hypothetical protein